MNYAISPEPHFIPGYTGHCPRYMYRVGHTYGHLTHKALASPCASHGKELVLSPMLPRSDETDFAVPTNSERNVIKNRECFFDAVYRDPIVPGYKGHIPRMASQMGKRFYAAAIAALGEHEAEMEILRCESRHRTHSDFLASGQGLFESKVVERMIPLTRYRSPLTPLPPSKSRYIAFVRPTSCDEGSPKLEPYSKDTVPHFMEDDDERKWIVSGYSGHIPSKKLLYGQSNKPLCRRALSNFSYLRRFRERDRWCHGSPEFRNGARNCPNTIYTDDTGLIPHYAGHVPGHLYKIGLRYSQSTANADRWLREHRDIHCYDC